MVNGVSFMKPQTPAVDPMGNRAKAQLGKEAIRYALNGDWEQALTANRQILDICPTDCEASNRLSKALIELGNYTEARLTLERLVEQSPQNVIARKNLARLDQLQSSSGEGRAQTVAAGKSPGMFIADSGRSCTTTLCQQADASDLASVSAGDVVLLCPGNDAVVVNTSDGRYLGKLQRRLGRRLHKLMTGGNRYEAAVVGLYSSGLSVILRETDKAPSLRNVVSFPAQVNEAGPRVASTEDGAHVPFPQDDTEPAMVDPIDSEDTMDAGEMGAGESALIDLPDETADEPDGTDEVPTLETDGDTSDWQPVAPTVSDDEDWD